MCRIRLLQALALLSQEDSPRLAALDQRVLACLLAVLRQPPSPEALLAALAAITHLSEAYPAHRWGRGAGAALLAGNDSCLRRLLVPGTWYLLGKVLACGSMSDGMVFGDQLLLMHLSVPLFQDLLCPPGPAGPAPAAAACGRPTGGIGKLPAIGGVTRPAPSRQPGGAAAGTAAARAAGRAAPHQHAAWAARVGRVAAGAGAAAAAAGHGGAAAR